MAWKVPGEFAEAIDWFRDRLPITDDAFQALEERSHRRAFVVAGIGQLDVVTDVWKAVERAITDGDDLDDFREAVLERLMDEWGDDVDDPGRRVETIFRTNIQSAYGAGRYRQATDPDVLEDHPIWMFDAILDGRESTICHECDGTKLPADHDWWKTHNPPLHHQCRSTVTTMTKKEAGKLTAKPSKLEPTGDFGAAPLEGDDAGFELDDWAEEKIEAAPEPLAAVAKKRLKRSA